MILPKHGTKCNCPDCYIPVETIALFDRWWREERPVTTKELNQYTSDRQLYYAAMYGFDGAVRLIDKGE